LETPQSARRGHAVASERECTDLAIMRPPVFDPQAMADIIDYSDGISTIDSEFMKLVQTSIHLVVEGGRAAIIDTAGNNAVPIVLEALAQKGLTPEDVDYIVLTHIHLDHAGGAGLLMTKCPNARLTVHPRGARHIADPRRLMEGTIAVYGAEAAARLYGDIVPVPAERIVETPHDATVSLNGRELRFLDTPGHARHHVCIVDGRTGHIFSGDTFGLSYRELDRDGRRFVFPTTSPVQFDPVALHCSIEMIESLHPEAIYVTHYSQVRDIPRLAGDLHRLIDAHERIALEAKDAGPDRIERLKEGVKKIILEERLRQGWALPADQLLEVFKFDIELNAQGLSAWLDAAA
jgi:glyoxylase-like metal-dependent hydrolase (beta-lactamase superfamily II)